MKLYRYLIITIVFAAASVSALGQAISDDEAFRKGTLDNGMTYYLYHNENPAGVAEFYIAHNVGALQEEDNQNGLAHFLEHMAFNGTKHYPEKGILDFLAKDGVRFGYNVNAYTSRRETVYNISQVPLMRESFVDSVLMVLHDWSCDISCEQQALDDERGVISEEWRLRDEPRYRMMCRQIELVYRGGKQPQRTVLGTMDVINGFRREDILDFYHKWYRPDLQAIIIVGDFDVNAMEAKVKSKFSDIPMPQNPPQKAASYLPPAQEGPLFADMTDPSIKYKAYKIICKQPYPDVKEHMDESFYRDRFARGIITTVLADRLREKSRTKGCPFQSAVAVTNEEEPDFVITMFTITPRKDNEIGPALKAVATEIERMCRFGISRDEFEVAKLGLASRLHLDRAVYREDVRNSDVVKRCVENFLRSYPLVDPIEWQELQRNALASVEYDSLRTHIRSMLSESEKIYSTCYNSKEPQYALGADDARSILAEVAAMDLQPEYLEYPELDLEVRKSAGSIVKRETIAHGIEHWTLSNGAEVWYSKASEVQSDTHLAMDIYFPTGYRAYPQDNIAAGEFAASYYRRYAGFRGVDHLNMKNYPQMAGVSVTAIPGVEKSYVQVSAQQSRIETAFRAAHLQLSEPYFISEGQFEKTRSEGLKSLSRKKNQRDLHAIRESKVVYGDNPWNVVLDSAAVNAVTYEMMKAQYMAEFGDYAHMKVYICSDAPQSEIEDHVCRYMASLIPSDSEVKLAEAHPLWEAFKGRREFFETEEPISVPMCQIDYFFLAKLKKDTRTREAIKILDHALSDRYLALIREQRGGAYHVDFTTNVYLDPQRPVCSEVSFQTRPELRDILLKDIEDVMDDMCRKGPSDSEIDAARKYFIKHEGESRARRANSIPQQLKQVEYYAAYGIDYDYDYASVMESIDSKFVRKIARKIASGSRLIETYTEE